MTTEHGTIMAVEENPLGDELVKDYVAGAVAIEVQDVSDFPEFGGSITLPGETIDYDRVDDDASTLLLSAPTTLDHSAEELVLLDPPVKRYTAHVHIDDVAGEVVLADLSHSLKMYLPLGDRDQGAGESVVISNENGMWEVTDVLGVLPALVGPSIDIPDTGEDGFHVDAAGNWAVDGASSTRGRLRWNHNAGALEIYLDPDDANPVLSLDENGDAELAAGPGGGAALDVILRRAGPQTWMIDDFAGDGGGLDWGGGSGNGKSQLGVADYIELAKKNADPGGTPPAGTVRVYSKVVAGTSKLFAQDDAGGVHPLW